LMLFLYNTGARVSEALGVRVEHLSLSSPQHVRLFGKGRKERLCPLWRENGGSACASAGSTRGPVHRARVPQSGG
jgi:site-specific recombinase XerD